MQHPINDRLTNNLDRRIVTLAQQRIANRAVPCEPTIARTTKTQRLKASKSTANGQYKRLTLNEKEYEIIKYPGQDLILRREIKTGREVPILEKIDGDWYTCDGAVLRSCELKAMQAFPGSLGIDPDAAIKRQRYVKRQYARKGMTHVAGKTSYVQPKKRGMNDGDRRNVEAIESSKKNRNLLNKVSIR